MPRISKLSLNQVNDQIDKIDELHQRLSDVEDKLDLTNFLVSQLDFAHARATFNNITFTWTGGTLTLSWNKGWIRDKNSIAPVNPILVKTPSYKNSSNVIPAIIHNIPVAAGTLPVLASTYYWLAWNTNNHTMYALTDITKLYTQPGMQIICQLFTGTGGQSGIAGGGGSQGGSDLSGARYKLF